MFAFSHVLLRLQTTERVKDLQVLHLHGNGDERCQHTCNSKRKNYRICTSGWIDLTRGIATDSRVGVWVRRLEGR